MKVIYGKDSKTKNLINFEFEEEDRRVSNERYAVCLP